MNPADTNATAHTGADLHSAEASASAVSESLFALLLRRWGWVLVTFVASRLIIAFLTRLSRMIFYRGEFWPRNGITGMLTQGDGERYLHIAGTGYGTGAEGLAHVGFFPLYPALIRVFSVIFEPPMAAMVVSNLALIIAGILLKELVDLLYNDTRISNAAVTFLMFSPLSFLFSGAYPEATFLALALGAFLAAARGQWLAASLCGAAVALTSAVGWIIVVPLALEYFRSGDARAAARRAAGGALLALIPLACGAFLLFSYLRVGDPLAPFRAAPVLEGGAVAPWVSLASAEWLPKFYRHFTLLMLAFALLLFGAGLLLKVRASHLLFAALLLLAYTCSAGFASIARELNVVFPFFIILAVLTKRLDWLYEPMLASTVTIFAFCTILSANGHWMR